MGTHAASNTCALCLFSLRQATDKAHDVNSGNTEGFSSVGVSVTTDIGENSVVDEVACSAHQTIAEVACSAHRTAANLASQSGSEPASEPASQPAGQPRC